MGVCTQGESEVIAVPEPLSCGQKVKGLGPVEPLPEAQTAAASSDGGNQKMTARVGHEAPDFKAEGYHQGQFKVFQLSEYRGHWTLLCFYPGDFTFV